VVQAVGVSDAVDGGVEGGKEGQDIRYEACSVLETCQWEIQGC
jgi:hypothetical protein